MKIKVNFSLKFEDGSTVKGHLTVPAKTNKAAIKKAKKDLGSQYQQSIESEFNFDE